MKFKIEQKLNEILTKWNIDKKVELTKAKGHADYSTNLAMKLSKELKNSPINIANKLIKEIDLEFLESIEIAGPGFINFFVKESVFKDRVNEITKLKKDFGKGKQNKFINVEYVSANPTGYLHIGHARGAILGSVLVDILRYSGNKVDAEYYINDAGNQIDLLGESVRVRYLQKIGIDTPMPEESYKGIDILDVANIFFQRYGDSLKNESFERFKVEASDYLLKIIDKDLRSYKVNMDFYSSEKKVYEDNLIEPALKKLKNFTFEEGGALWLNTMAEGDDKNRVLVKSDKKLTYFTPDIAYHDVKLSRGYDELVNIWGADHIGYIKRMEIALFYLGLPKDKLDIFTVQMVKLIKSGKELKMSKRSGNTFTMQDLIKEASIDQIRWSMVDRSKDSELVFDINKANSKNPDNPVFNVQYTNARALKLIDKSTINSLNGSYTLKEKELINLLYKFPEIIEKISSNHKTQLLPQYLLEISKDFNSWYANEKIIGSPFEGLKIQLVKATQIIIQNGLELLGISVPKKM